MAINPHLKRLMKETITIATPPSTNGWSPSTPTTTTAKAFIERGTRLVVNAEGKEVPSTTRVFIDGGATIGEEYTVTLPDGKSYPVVAVKSPHGFRKGLSHHEVAL